MNRYYNNRNFQMILLGARHLHVLGDPVLINDPINDLSTAM